MSNAAKTTNLQFARFFVPLALQAASQSLTYPLVATVASRGPGGTLNLAGLSQASQFMFLLGTLGMGLVTTGMVYGKFSKGYNRFRVTCYSLAAITILMQTFCSIPEISHFIFGVIMGVPSSIETPARAAFFCSIPLHLLFFLRTPYQVVLYNNKATARASGATLGRIIITAGLAPIFCHFNLVGPRWAVMCQTLPVCLEVLVSYYFAYPFIKNIEKSTGTVPKLKEMFLFTLPLSMGYLFLSLSGFMIAAFISRAPFPERMLPAYYLAIGLANPMAYGATRIQSVVIAFSTPSAKYNTALGFAAMAGLISGLIPVIFTIPCLAKIYYVLIQNLPVTDLQIVKQTALVFIGFPMSVAIRAQCEGVAACLKKPITVLAGQAVYLGTVATIGFLTLSTGFPGNLIGPIAIISGNIASTFTMRMALQWEKQTEIPVPQTRISHVHR